MSSSVPSNAATTSVEDVFGATPAGAAAIGADGGADRPGDIDIAGTAGNPQPASSRANRRIETTIEYLFIVYEPPGFF
jgi:hypothetical protein